MNKFITILICFQFTIVIGSCETKPHFKHKFDYEKVAERCENIDPAFRMTSNLNGERYQFQQCLEADFDGKQYSVERKGDTVVVQFSPPRSTEALYNITLDIITYPRYNFLTIGENTFPIIPTTP